MFSNFQFLVTGVPRVGPGKSVIPGDDTGREEHTGRLSDRYSFRVPSLRNVEFTAPYMHAGVFDTLEEVLRFYNDGATPRHDRVTDDMLEVILRLPLELSDEELTFLLEFLKSLTDSGSQLDPLLLTVPAAVPSGLTPVFGVKGSSGTRSHAAQGLAGPPIILRLEDQQHLFASIHRQSFREDASAGEKIDQEAEITGDPHKLERSGA